MKDFRLLLSLALTFTTVFVFAQGAPPATPIDGGLSILLVAGGIYGLKKLNKGRSND